jgi:hypothetical protein
MVAALHCTEVLRSMSRQDQSRHIKRVPSTSGQFPAVPGLFPPSCRNLGYSRLEGAFAERGVAVERLARFKAPARLDLGAITPNEITFSILAEIVAVHRGVVGLIGRLINSSKSGC